MRHQWILAVILGGCVDGDALRDGLSGTGEVAGQTDAAAVDARRDADAGALDRGMDRDPDQGRPGCGPEVCNGADDDCDGVVDEEIRMACGPAEAGVGQCVAGALTCNAGLLSECIGSVGPAVEFCDTVDNDCDGQVDEGLECACERGQTQDCFSGTPAQNGVGVCRPGLQACDPEALVFGPCTEEVAPRMEECNGLDDDCDGMADEGLVAPGEECQVGAGACARPGVLQCGADGRICMGEPGAPGEETCDGVDEDCDGRVDEDFDVGGACAEGVGACRFEGRLQCDGGALVCNGGDAGGPQDENVCNGEDDDCDGEVDEPPPCYDGPGQTENVGACRGGQLTCDNGCVGQVLPEDEACNGLDDDCDGAVDEIGCVCQPGEQVGCYEGDGAPGVGQCREGERTCGPDRMWGPCQGVVGPAGDGCDGVDNDCDGAVDERVVRTCGTDVGRCRSGEEACVDGRFAGPCQGAISPRGERCDGVDDDCDGRTDEDTGGGACGSDVGRCRRGAETCVGGRITCSGGTGPRAERCDGVDDDCDGRTDEGVSNACGGCGAIPNEACNGADDDCDGQVDEGLLNACGDCGAVPAEACNGQDDDCDGAVDEGAQNACGECGPVPREVCNGEDDDCDGRTDETVLNACGVCGPVLAEVCNGEDEDCDGQIDEGVSNACGGCGPVPSETCDGRDQDCDGEIDEGGANWCFLSFAGRANSCNDGACTCGGNSTCRAGQECMGNRCENECGGNGQPACE